MDPGALVFLAMLAFVSTGALWALTCVLWGVMGWLEELVKAMGEIHYELTQLRRAKPTRFEIREVTDDED